MTDSNKTHSLFLDTPLAQSWAKLHPAFADTFIYVLVCVVDEIELLAKVFDVLIWG